MPAGKNYFEISEDCVDCGECEAECGFHAISAE
jgi:ferredoxin